MLHPELQELIKLKQVVQRSAGGQRYQYSKTVGDYTSILHGLGVEFETIRPYVVGDDVRYIDWRTTARTGKPQVKTFRAECDRNVLVVVDANSYMRFGTQGTFKSVQAAKTAAVMMWASLQENDRVGGLVFGDVKDGMQLFSPSKSQSSALSMLRLLCDRKFNQHRQVSILDAINRILPAAKPKSLVIIVADFSIEPIEKLRKSLMAIRRTCNVLLIPIYDQFDATIPDAGTIICTEDDNEEVIYTGNRQARERYALMWQQYCSDLDKTCKQLQIPLVWVATRDDPVRKIWKS